MSALTNYLTNGKIVNFLAMETLDNDMIYSTYLFKTTLIIPNEKAAKPKRYIRTPNKSLNVDGLTVQLLYTSYLMIEELIMRKLTRKILLLGLLFPLVFACKKKKGDVDPFGADSVCPLLAMIDQDGNSIRDFEYVQSNLMRIYDLDDPETTMSFRYNENNVIKTMEVETKNESQTLKVEYVYDAEGRVNQTKTTVAGIPIQKNSFVLSDGKITSVVTTVTLFGKQLSSNTRLVYSGDNVTQVYTSFDGEPEKLAFVGDKYDDKPQFNPKAYKTAALGFVGLANNFFSFFGQNNLVSGKIYDEDGKVDQKTNIIYNYNKKGLPVTSEITTERNGEITTKNVTYEFLCN